MQCPFLKEVTVRYCAIAPVRKLVPREAIEEDDQLCTTSAYLRCRTAQAHLTEQDQLPRCPFLQETQVQYCAAAEVTKFIPCNHSVLSRCNSDNHRHCPLYLQRAHPGEPTPEPTERENPSTCAPATRGAHHDDTGIPVPAGFAFTPNHMWIDIGENGCCDIGVDALFARVLGRVDRIRFVSSQGPARPRATITIDDLDLDLTFPLHLDILAANALLRVHPETMIADPYGAGWLFAARTSPTSEQGSNAGSPMHLLQGGQARQWMRAECDRLARFVHDLQAQRCDRSAILMSDGGVVSHGLWQHLHRDEQRRLFNRFFTESSP